MLILSNSQFFSFNIRKCYIHVILYFTLRVDIVFFYKCKADYLRYLLHFKTGEPKNKLIRRSSQAYVSFFPAVPPI